MDLCISKIRNLFSYDHESGVLIWKNPPNKHKRLIGLPAGAKKTSRSSGKSYIYIIIDNISYSAHRIAWAHYHGSHPKNQIDHLNGDGTDNRIINLEDKTADENQKNKKLFCNNKTGIPGVRLQSNGSFRTEIRVMNKHIHLLVTNDFFEACCARKSAENKYGFHENHGSIRSL